MWFLNSVAFAGVLDSIARHSGPACATDPPVSEPPAIYCTMVRRTAGFEALIGAELAHMYGAAEAELGVYVSDVPIPWGETAFGVAGGRQLAAAATLEELGAQLRALELRPSSFGIRLFRIPQTAKGGVAAKTVVGDSILCTAVDPLSTACPLGLIISPAGFRVFVRDDDGGDADWLRVERRPNNLPISIGVRLAKALLNLTVGRPCEADRFVVFDPFAGSGTIPLVAALSGHTALGSDIDRKAMKLAAGNATALGAIAVFCQEDARESTQRADCIISMVVAAECRLAGPSMLAFAPGWEEPEATGGGASESAMLGSAELLPVEVEEELMVTASELVMSDGCSGVMARSGSLK